MSQSAKVSEIKEMLMKGKAKVVKTLVEEAVSEGVSVEEILNDGLLAGMSEVGEKFKRNEVFVPEVMVAARAMNMGMGVLEPLMTEGNYQPVGKAVIGTVHGDLHDIGKNLVGMMLKGAGFEVCDAGVDVTAEQFISKAEEIGADIIGMSALLTTTMPYMKEVLDELNNRGLREKYIVMIGGAPVTQEFCDQIGADIYTSDAGSVATAAKQAVLAKK